MYAPERRSHLLWNRHNSRKIWPFLFKCSLHFRSNSIVKVSSTCLWIRFPECLSLLPSAPASVEKWSQTTHVPHLFQRHGTGSIPDHAPHFLKTVWSILAKINWLQAGNKNRTLCCRHLWLQRFHSKLLNMWAGLKKSKTWLYVFWATLQNVLLMKKVNRGCVCVCVFQENWREKQGEIIE